MLYVLSAVYEFRDEERKVLSGVVGSEHKPLIEDGRFEFTAINDEKEYQQHQKKCCQRYKSEFVL